MAILYTQGTWVFSEDHSAIVAIKDHKVKMVADFGKSDLPETEANAKLILNAVNNTAGKGIDPVAVPGLLNRLKQLRSDMNQLLGTVLAGKEVSDTFVQCVINDIEKAIKSAEIK